jgi:nucleoid-associated protein YgaU
MHILRAGVKVAAVLGIAFVTLLLIAAILYPLLSAQLSQEQGAAVRQDTNGLPSHRVGSETAASSERASPTSSRIREADRSMSVSEPRISGPKSPASEPKPSNLTPDTAEISSPQPKHDAEPGAEASPLLGAGSAPEPTQVSPPPPSTFSEAAAETSPSSGTASAPAEARYYTVAEGDTLYSIARRIYGAGKYWQAIYDANRDLIDDPVRLKLRWKLELPPPEKVIPEN